MPNSIKRIVRKPAFMQGGTVIADNIIRDDNGYPLDQNGKIDLHRVKVESLRYHKAALNTMKKSNYTPPKKTRK